MMGIAQQNFESINLGQGVKHRPPVHAGCLHRYVRNLFSTKPFRHLQQSTIERREPTHLLRTRFATAITRVVRDANCHRDLPLVHVDPGNLRNRISMSTPPPLTLQGTSPAEPAK
jgi:hypothetical protein